MVRLRVMHLAIAAACLALASSAAHSALVTAARTDTINHSDTTSGILSANTAGVALGAENGWAPVAYVLAPGSVATSAQAGQITSVTPKKSYSIVGTSTSAGSWTDGNGVPAGITLTFDAQFSISVGAGAVANSVIALGTTPGNGIGLAQVVGGTGNVNAANEPIDVSAVAVSAVNFLGSLAEAGFTFTPGTVSNFGSRVFRSNNFAEGSTGMTLTQGGPSIIGFGGVAGGPFLPVAGSVASGVTVNNNFTDATSIFPRQVGAYTLTWAGPSGGSGWSLKGIGLGYDVTYDIAAVAIPEPTASIFGGLAACFTVVACVWRFDKLTFCSSRASAPAVNRDSNRG